MKQNFPFIILTIFVLVFAIIKAFSSDTKIFNPPIQDIPAITPTLFIYDNSKSWFDNYLTKNCYTSDDSNLRISPLSLPVAAPNITKENFYCTRKSIEFNSSEYDSNITVSGQDESTPHIYKKSGNITYSYQLMQWESGITPGNSDLILVVVKDISITPDKSLFVKTYYQQFIPADDSSLIRLIKAYPNESQQEILYSQIKKQILDNPKYQAQINNFIQQTQKFTNNFSAITDIQL